MIKADWKYFAVRIRSSLKNIINWGVDIMDNVSTAVHWIKLPWDLTPLHISCGIFPLETFGLVVGFSLTTSDVICWLLYTVHQPKQ